MFKKTTIVGVGLIGGSLGMAMMSGGLAGQITGLTRHKHTLSLAKRSKAVTKGTLDFKKAVKDADLVIIAAPISKIVKVARDIMPFLKQGSIVTDVGSLKGEIVKQIDSIPRIRKKEVYFVGSHPMAGSEKSGVCSARKDLFKGSFCFLTRTRFTDQKALNKIRKLWEKLGAEVKVVSPVRHDSIVTYISHLPHILAYHLSMLVPFKYYKYSGGSFLDMTRIASSNPRLWRDICVMNSREIGKALGVYQTSIGRVKNIVSAGRHQKLLSLFKKAKNRRDSYNREWLSL
ncbi:MAG: prephenate dehydrogenase [Candidatus Omnitrophota bacterium]|nr:prephenate dehydrogenase [Candidatus Omnitrophota bacterium]